MILECKDLKVGYRGKEVVKDINFSLDGGEYVCIIGQNGAGKSTLVKTLLGLEEKIDGTICFDTSIKKGDIGYLPQQEESQRDFPASVFEIVLSGMQGASGKFFYSKADKIKAGEAIAKMKMNKYKKESFSRLSGGQKQRVLLARAICAGAKIIFLDEPVAGLDPEMRLMMYSSIRELNVEYGITIIMISHDMEAVEKYASHVLYISGTPKFMTSEEYLAGCSCDECMEEF